MDDSVNETLDIKVLEFKEKLEQLRLDLMVAESQFNNISNDEELLDICYKKMLLIREEINYVFKKAKKWGGSSDVDIKICG